MNDNPKYPQILAVLEEIPLPDEPKKPCAAQKPHQTWQSRNSVGQSAGVSKSWSEIIVSHESPLAVGFQPVIQVKLIKEGCHQLFAEFERLRTQKAHL
jgi:hypothetical protein